MAIISFAGHLLDQPGRTPPRFPAALEGGVAQALAEKLAHLDAEAGFASAACGADILFHEALQALGLPTTVVLPFPVADFLSTSVNIHPDIQWQGRFEKVLAQAKAVKILSNHAHLHTGADYELASLVLDGLAKMAAQQQKTTLQPLVVWDGFSGDGTGGTAWLVQQWQKQGLHPEIISTTALLGQPPQPPKFAVPAPLNPTQPTWQVLPLALLPREENDLTLLEKLAALPKTLFWQSVGADILIYGDAITALPSLAEFLQQTGITNAHQEVAVVLRYQQRLIGQALAELSAKREEKSERYQAVAAFFSNTF